MTIYFVNINKNVNNVRVYTIKRHIKGDGNKLSKAVESLIQKYLLKEKPADVK